ncbi:unnamed protein product [Leptosia nina]|uniref:PHD-type domain-containing protein n=1 Tax=Leptosia nina TaxID=320188 RepID=A0AAV1K1T3_9NEOP
MPLPKNKLECCIRHPNSTEVLMCTSCNKKYHYNCVSTSKTPFGDLTDAYKVNWLCPSCARPKSDNSNTPIRGAPLPREVQPASPLPFDEVRKIVREELGAVLEVFKTNIREQFKLLTQEVLDQLSGVTNSLTFLEQQYEQVASELSVKTKAIKVLESENISLKSTVKDLNVRLSIVEQQSRAANLEIQNVPEIRDTVLAAVITFNKKAGNNTEKLNTSHLGISGSKYPIFVGEHLTSSQKQLHAKARLRAKELGYKLNVLNCNYDIIILTETWLNVLSVYNSEIFDDRYNVYRRDRSSSTHTKHKTTGGGVLIAVLKTLPSLRLNSFESDCEDLWVSIKISRGSKSINLNICAIYISPPVKRTILETFIDKATESLEQIMLQNCNSTFIVGDFNLGGIKWFSESNKHKVTNTGNNLFKTFIDFTHLNGLNQLNNISNVKGSILDLVLTTETNSSAVNESPFPLSIIDSYHPPLIIDIPIPLLHTPPILCKNKTVKPNFRKCDYTLIEAALDNIKWLDEFHACPDVNKLTYRRSVGLCGRF